MPPAATTTIDAQLAEIGKSDQYNFGLSLDEQMRYQHKNANDIAYWKFLLDEAEQFFNGRIKDLEQVH